MGISLLYTFAYLTLLGILSHLIGEAIPYNRFDPHAWLFRTRKWERGGRIYEAIGIKRWKDRLPDMSKIVKRMHPKRLGIAPSAKAVRRLIRETCRAEIVHGALCLLAPPIWLFWRNATGVWISLLTVLGNLPFILIQRYNRPALLRLEERLAAREERRKKP
jgi:glycosyl-4,4'-diaponeurosporenoate acyltransferase